MKTENIGAGLVSVGLPVYNGSKFLRRALDSLLGQTYKNFELIVSDNASTDDTGVICEKYAAQDARIRYIRQKENIGGLKNFNFVLSLARGEYFMWAAHDDWWDPFFIERLKIALDDNHAYGVAMSSFERALDGKLMDKLVFSGLNDFTNLSHGQAFFKIILPGRPFHYFIYGLMRTALLKKMMARPLPPCERNDRVIMGELALAARFYSLPDILWKKTMYAISAEDRHKDIFGNLSQNKKIKRLQYIYWVGRRVIASPIVPLSRKITFLPFYLKLVLSNFRKLTK